MKAEFLIREAKEAYEKLTLCKLGIEDYKIYFFLIYSRRMF